MCADLREPNKAVVTDCYPLPHVDKLFTNLQGAKIFSTIDLANAYYQLPLHKDSRDLTAFITHNGLFRFCRVPCGPLRLSENDGWHSQRTHLEDIIVYGNTPAEHDQNLNTALQKLKEAGLVPNDNKCHFRKSSLRFLGHIITADGILPDREHINAVLKAPPPSNAAAWGPFWASYPGTWSFCLTLQQL